MPMIGIKWNPEVQLGHVLQLGGGLFIGVSLVFGVYLGIIRNEGATSERLTQQDGKILLVSQRIDVMQTSFDREHSENLQFRQEMRTTLDRISSRLDDLRAIASRLDALPRR